MYTLMIFFSVVITIIVPKNAVESKSSQDVDIRKLLSLIRNQQITNNQNSDTSDDSTDSNNRDDFDGSESSAKDYTRSKGTGGDNLSTLIEKIINEKHNFRLLHDNQKHNPFYVYRAHHSYNKNNNKYGSSQKNHGIGQMLENLISKDLKNVDVKTQPNVGNTKKYPTPNRLLGYVKDNQDDGGNIDENSRVYIILNPEGIRKTKKSNDPINNLIYKLLSLPPSHTNEDRQKSYKGFVLKEHNARRRASRESGNSAEDKPKRGRGGGGAGRTAIPYVHQRGENIYEKD